MMIEQVGNPNGLKPLTAGNLEWSNPEVPNECDDEPESNKLNNIESILMYEKETNNPSHAPLEDLEKIKVKKRRS
jgi:hypothetical protein